MSYNKKILCIGAGYVGGPTMAMIADQCPDYEVYVVDINVDRINAWNSQELPIYEPGLNEVVFRNRGKNLFFSTDLDRLIEECDIIFVSVNTPTKTYGEGAGYSSNVEYLEKAARNICKHATRPKVVVEKSTLPVRSAEALENIFRANAEPRQFSIVSNPEFLAEGTAIEDLKKPDRVLIGGHNTEDGSKAVQAIVDIYANWIPRERILTTNLWSSELAKLVANAFLAQRVSSINSISALCEATEANVDEIARAIGHDSRIGGKFLKAGVGFGGSCFQKDILNLVYICRRLGLKEVADYWEGVVKINNYQKDRFFQKVMKRMFNTISGKKLAILGFAFKADTGDTREAPAIDVCRQLLEERALLSISDPKALPNARLDLKDHENLMFEEDPYKAAEGAHGILILTDWKEYQNLDFQRLYDSMEKPAFIFDGRNFLDHQKLHELGFNVDSLGIGNYIH